MKSSKRNLLIGFGFSLFLLVVSAVASFVSISKLLNSSELVNHTSAVISNLESVISILKDAETGQRGFLITGEDAFLEPYNGALAKAVSTIDELKKLTTDNPDQQADIERLRDIVVKRISRLQTIIDNKRQNGIFTTEDMRTGKSYMDQARALVRTMQDRENRLLAERTAEMNRMAGYTPILLVVACTLSLLVTIIFFSRLNNDFEKRAQLQAQLESKDAEITERITIIQGVASRISAGDYSIRVSDEQKDNLGNLSVSLNRMAESLDQSFQSLSLKEWLQTGIAGLNEKIAGEKNMRDLCNEIISFTAEYTGSQAGALYILQDNSLHFISGYAFIPAAEKKIIQPGEGIAGQCLQKGREVLVRDLSPDAITISYSGGDIRPSEIIAIPLLFENNTKAVIELVTVNSYGEKERAFLETISHNAGIAVNTAENRRRLHELLAETEAQSEELRIQHSELENINAELEAQAEKLQVSEEELKVQQEELVQSNEELEERTRLLEEKNQVIAERNREIQSKAEQLEITTRYKSEFLANMSHELRTPLNSILLLSRLLAENNDKNLTTTEIEYADVIHSSGRGLLTLIDEILDLSKIEAGKMDVEYSQVRTEAVLSNMRALFDPVANDKKLQLTISSDKAAPTLIETDALRLEQVLKNLLSNALKFTTQGSVSLHVSGRPGEVVFNVTDTGIGIPPEKQAFIFEAFQQADGSTRRKFGGTGLGLSISRELVKLLGGHITLKSEPGKGSTFTVSLPIVRGAVIEQPQLHTQTSPAPQPVAPAEKYTTEFVPSTIPDDRDAIRTGDKVILVIEDDTAFSRSLLDFIRQKGYKAVAAVQGEEGVALARQFRPAGILLDIQLPVKNGWEVMEELKDDAQTRHIPVHIMSSYEVKRKSRMMGAVDFINKPLAFEQLQEVFDKIEHIINQPSGKVLIVEDNQKHAQALALYLENYHVNSAITSDVKEGIKALDKDGIDCVIIDIGIADQLVYDTLETVKKTPGLENLPVIIFTGKNLSRPEEQRIKKYADSIIVKTAHSYQRILDEVSLFLHLVEDRKQPATKGNHFKKLGMLKEVLTDKTVLIVDDDVRNIFSLTRALESYKVKVLTAVDGKEALKQLAENPGIDLVIMDMMMPEMDGYEATAQIRKNPLYKNLPVLAVTAKAMTGDREKCIKAGASDYITKPVDIDQLLSLLRVWLYNK
jgi:signal transduction histidine kinase/DNA-binding response OmpR family regulator/CHASE3 domain sensor protein/HAMP domain-containing protein